VEARIRRSSAGAEQCYVAYWDSLVTWTYACDGLRSSSFRNGNGCLVVSAGASYTECLQERRAEMVHV
jgi:hypothetical protein